MYCRKCGEKIINDSKFCSYCGSEIINVKKLPGVESNIIVSTDAYDGSTTTNTNSEIKNDNSSWRSDLPLFICSSGDETAQNISNDKFIFSLKDKIALNKIKIDDGTKVRGNDIAKILKSNGFMVIDKRPKGSLWILYIKEKEELYKKIIGKKYKYNLTFKGGRATDHKAAWWIEP